MPEYDNRNSGLLFKSTSNHPNAPAFSGPWTDENNNQMQIKAYWSKKPDKNGNLFLQVSKDTYEKSEQPTGKESPAWQKAREKLGPQEVPVAGTIEDDGTINYDEPINLDDIPF